LKEEFIMAIMLLNIIPLGTKTASVGDYVVDCQRALRAEGVEFRLTDMGTIIAGETPQLLALAARIHAMPFARGVQRVVTQISIDERRDKSVSLGDKVHSVQERL
jgi:uncharacterized protein (TIGR00106 family)